MPILVDQKENNSFKSIKGMKSTEIIPFLITKGVLNKLSLFSTFDTFSWILPFKFVLKSEIFPSSKILVSFLNESKTFDATAVKKRGSHSH